jgi:hypothetical protein
MDFIFNLSYIMISIVIVENIYARYTVLILIFLKLHPRHLIRLDESKLRDNDIVKLKATQDNSNYSSEDSNNKRDSMLKEIFLDLFL